LFNILELEGLWEHGLVDDGAGDGGITDFGNLSVAGMTHSGDIQVVGGAR
jgi:hypothetical protein